MPFLDHNFNPQKELQWWLDNRSVQVRSPFSNQTFTMFHYSVNNTAPRPESYLAGVLDFFLI